MTHTSPKQTDIGFRLLTLVVVLVVVASTGCARTATNQATADTTPITKQSQTTTSTSDLAGTADPATTTTQIRELSEPDPIEYPTGIVPSAIEIPAIDLIADTIQLDLSGPEPEVPKDYDQTGWYDQTRRPGEIGPAVIAGHIDSASGPAVFARLDELVPGDEILVNDDSGQQRRFAVQRTGQYPKGDLPAEVFGFDQPTAELRLITCGGTFDRSIGHYRDNLVVYAVSLDEAR